MEQTLICFLFFARRSQAAGNETETRAPFDGQEIVQAGVKLTWWNHHTRAHEKPYIHHVVYSSNNSREGNMVHMHMKEKRKAICVFLSGGNKERKEDITCSMTNFYLWDGIRTKNHYHSINFTQIIGFRVYETKSTPEMVLYYRYCAIIESYEVHSQQCIWMNETDFQIVI